MWESGMTHGREGDMRLGGTVHTSHLFIPYPIVVCCIVRGRRDVNEVDAAPARIPPAEEVYLLWGKVEEGGGRWEKVTLPCPEFRWRRKSTS